jgi:23S rRNA A2030 N6-methylase RlmJ
MAPQQPFNYQHDEWIGGHGNVLKHVVVTSVVQEYQKLFSDNKGIMFVDCMAGDGIYDLNQHNHPDAYLKGILQVMVQAEADPLNTPDAVQQYIQMLIKITGCTNSQDLDVYPGSPMLVQHALRAQLDEHRLLNNNDDEIQWLQLNSPKHAATSVRTNVDVFDVENSIEFVLPYIDTTNEKHPIIFIDPDYTLESDYGNTKKLLMTILDQCSHATVIVTIPLIHNHKFRYTYVNGLRDVAKQFCSVGRYYCNIVIGNKDYEGDAVFVCNPTSDLDNILDDHCIHWLANVMNIGKDEYTVEQVMKKKKDSK